MSTNELRLVAAEATGLGAHVVLAGRWLWASFDQKPVEAVRTALKGSGWRWSKKSARWYFRGCPSAGNPNRPMGFGYVALKYGLEEVEQ